LNNNRENETIHTLKKEDYKIPKSITVICLGNICRSPVGEYLLRAYAMHSVCPEIWNIEFDSAGIEGGFLSLNQLSAEYLEEKGINCSKFHSKKINRQYLDRFDLILVMEDYMKEEIIQNYYDSLKEDEINKIRNKIKTLKEIVGKKGDIEDPYGQDRWTYRTILGEIDYLCKRFIQKLEKQILG